MYCRAGRRSARRLSATDGHVLLAPELNVIPLPHQQIHAFVLQASPAIVSSILLADEVGLGKTIEAGLIIRELKLRGLVRRTLVVFLHKPQ